MYNGLLNIYKEKDFTSHDVVAKLRGILRQKKIGHTGTLDPNAEGVLPVCLGKGTKLCDMLTGTKKQYQVSFVFEKETDTEDIWGTVTKTHGPLKEDAPIKDTILSFIGEYDQVPPMYSAKKINGKKLYELAREGKVIERKPRDIKILKIDIVDIDLENKTFTMDVTCSKGTYIRTLCHDIGKELGIGAAMENLVRTRVSVFEIKDALTLSDIEFLSKEKPEIFMEKVYSVDSLFDYSKLSVSGDGIKYLQNGNTLRTKDFKENAGNISEDERVLVYDENNNFRAIYQKKGKEFKVFRMF